jgi:hypothetical protein
MKNIRPFGWVIIILNALFFVSFLSGIDESDSDTVIGLGFMFLIFWLAVMNVFLYVLYRITGGKKRVCPACGSKVKVGITNCNKCGFDFMKAASGQIPIETENQQVLQVQQSEDVQGKLSNQSLLLTRILPPVGLILIVGYFLFSAFGQDSDDSYWCPSNPKIPAFSSECGNDSVNSAAPTDTSWLPSNFDVWSADPNVAWRWLKANEYACEYGDGCWAMMLIAKSGCPSGLYVELSLLDKNDVQVGYTNETVGSALPMQKTRMIFNSFEESAESGRISKISCY